MASPAPRVAITGIGVVSPFGVGRECFWDHISRGVSGTRAITEFEPKFACQVAASVPDASLVRAGAAGVDPGDEAAAVAGGGRADPRRYAKVSRIAVLAATEALRDAGLDPNGLDAGVIVGIVSSEISIALGLHGISHVLSTGCTSSTDAIGYAAMLIRQGEADVLITGGADACVTPGMIFGFSRMRIVATRYNDRPAEASRPFDRGRDGFVLGEGAWLMTVEREDRARARGARIYATIEGYGSTCDAYHRVQMDPEGKEIVRAMQLAVTRSGRSFDDIGYINYHGTSTQLNDAVEVQCVRRAFGPRAEQVPGSSTKSMIGHPQGASGAAGVVATALAIARGLAPPTINLTDPDPACDLDFIPNTARQMSIDTALCNCLGFGSKNSALVLGRA